MANATESRFDDNQDVREAIGALTVAAFLFIAVVAASFAFRLIDGRAISISFAAADHPAAIRPAAESTASHPLPAGRAP